jgi:hypothetical protein
MDSMSNSGVAPYDPSTLVGKVRVVTGDVNYGTPVGGFAEYEMFSDDEIEAFLVESEDSVLRAAAYGYLALSGRASLQAKTVKDYDLSVDLKAVAAELRKQADDLFKRADEKDGRDGVSDVFEWAATGRPYTVSELAEPENWLWNL